MITLDRIRQLEFESKTGADFPALIREFKRLDMLSFEFKLENGVIIYQFKEGNELKTEKQYNSLSICSSSDVKQFIEILKNHQKGKTDFPTFCKQASEAGVEKWIVDIEKMTCTYFDMFGKKILSEEIPQ